MDLYDRPQFVGPAVESKLDIIGITIWARAQLWDHRRLMSLTARQIAPARFPYPTKAT